MRHFTVLNCLPGEAETLDFVEILPGLFGRDVINCGSSIGFAAIINRAEKSQPILPDMELYLLLLGLEFPAQPGVDIGIKADGYHPLGNLVGWLLGNQCRAAKAGGLAEQTV